MGYTPDGYGWIGYSDSDPVLCEFAHADHITGLQVFYGAAQRLVTGGQQSGLFFLAQLIGGSVAPGGFDKLQRTVIGHEKSCKKMFGCFERCLGPPPQAFAADFASRTTKSHHRPLGVHVGGLAHRRFDIHPFFYRADFAERYAGLRHSPGAGVHADQNDLFSRPAISFAILRIGLAGVFQRIVNVGDRSAKPQSFQIIQ